MFYFTLFLIHYYYHLTNKLTELMYVNVPIQDVKNVTSVRTCYNILHSVIL